MLLKIRLHCCIGVYADFNSQAPPPSIRCFTNAAHSDLIIGECSCGQEVFLVIGEALHQEAIAARVIPSAMMDQVWHNGQVYKADDDH